MNFLRQLFQITRKRPASAEKLARPKLESVVATAIGYEQEEVTDNFFEYVIGYYDVKRLLKMSINADEPVHILLVGPPASSKDNVYQISDEAK